MSDNLWRPADTDNKILQKILNTLQFGIANPTSASTVQNIVNNATTNINNTTTGGSSVTGNVGGYTVVTRFSPVVTSGSAYSAGNAVGNLQQFSGIFRAAGTGILESIVLSDASNQAAALTLLFFAGNPAGTTGFACTDKTAFTFGTGGSLLTLEAMVNIAATDYTVINSTAVVAKTGLGIALRGTSQALWMAIITSGTPTWATTTPLNGQIGILQD